MTKQLLNLHTLLKITLIFTTLFLLLPLKASAEDTNPYGLTIGEVEVTSENASDILNDGKVSFDSETKTLTLNNAELRGSIISNLEALTISFQGTNTINGSISQKNGTQGTLAFIGADTGSLTVNFPSGSAIYNFTSVDFGDFKLSTNSSPGIFYIVDEPNNNPNQLWSNNIMGYASNVTLTKKTIYPLWIGTHESDYYQEFTQVTQDNITDILGDGKISFDGNHTLTLSGATITGSIISGLSSLDIIIDKENTIDCNGDSATCIRNITSGATLNLKNSNSETASLTVQGGHFIRDFKSISYSEEGLYLSAYNRSNLESSPIDLLIPDVYYADNDFRTSSNNRISYVKFSNENPSFLVMIGNTPITTTPTTINANDEEEDDILGVVGSVTLSFDEKGKYILTIDSIETGSANIVSTLPNLTIKYKGSCNIGKITSTYSNAPLTFGLAEGASGEDKCFLPLSNELPWEGFSGNPTFNDKLAYIPGSYTYSDSHYIKKLESPDISIDGGIYLSSDDQFKNGDTDAISFYYTIDYADKSKTDVSIPQKYEGFTSDFPFTISEPATLSVTAHYSYKGMEQDSENAIGKYFGFETEELTVPYQACVNAPNIVPAFPEGVAVNYQNNTDPTNPIDANGVININGLGTDIYYASTTGFGEERCYEGEHGEMITILNEIKPIADILTCEFGQFSLTVEPKDLKDVTIEDIADQTFTGNEIRPELVIKNGDQELQEAKNADDGDYTVSFSNNTAAALSTAQNAPSVTITGKGNYTGTATKTFTITAKSIENADVVLDNGSEFTYNEAKNVPTIKSASVTIGTSTSEVTAPSIPLTAETDYTISYVQVNGETEEAIEADKIINAGSYKMILTGKGNFSGTKTVAFTINPRPIENPIITLSATEFVYNTQAQKPTVTVQFTETSEVTKTIPATDYEVTYSGDCINVGSYTVSVSLKRNYSGSADGPSFTITKATITPTVTLEGWTYGATANEPSVTGNSGSGVVSYAYKLQHAAEEAYSATKPTNAGAYTVKASIAATANYEAATDSAHFTIAKAAGGLTYSAATASAELNGDGWTAPNLDNPNKLTVTYTSSNTAVATISETGIVTLVGTGEATIKAASDGDANHEASEAQYTLTVTRGRALGYGVWIGDIEVNEDNLTDILDDGVLGDDGEYTKAPSFIFNPEENTLLIINSNAELTIESRMPELKIHLSNDNKLKKVFYNNIGNPENKGTLLFTCDSNYPGSVTIGNTAGESAITGFSSVGYEFNLQALKPEKAKYTNGQMTDSLGVVADTITVGVPLEPIKSDNKEELNADDFTVTNPDGSTATVDLSSTNVNNIYYTLPESTEGQGYDPETNTISVVDPMTDEAVEQIAAATTSNSTTVGSNDYAENFIGLTFIVQGGEGVIRIDQETEDGYEFHLKIGDSPSITLKSGKEEIAYSLPDATYCWLYLVKSGPARATTRVGKRDHIPGNIRLVSVKANAVASTKPVKTVSGGSISPAVNIAITGIVEIEKDTPENKYDVETVNDKWYTIDGRPINKPSQKGIYIRNRKKVVVK